MIYTKIKMLLTYSKAAQQYRKAGGPAPDKTEPGNFQINHARLGKQLPMIVPVWVFIRSREDTTDVVLQIYLL